MERCRDRPLLDLLEGQVVRRAPGGRCGRFPPQEREVVVREDVSLGGHQRPLDCVLKLAHVAEPVLVEEQPEGALRNVRRLLSQLVREPLEEVVGQHGDVLAALAQGWDADVDDVEPVEEIVAERPGRDRLLQVDPGGGNHPHVDVDLLGASHAKE